MYRTWVTLAGCLLLTRSLPADNHKVAASPSEIAKLIEQLGDRDYATREAAGKRLSAIGEPALAPLAAVNSHNPEQAERAARLLGSIRSRIENEKALAPTLVELPKGEQSLRQVFDAIEQQSRVQLRIDGDQAVLSQKLILDGGKKPFWDHIQKAVTEAGLEVTTVNEYRTGSTRQTEEDQAQEIMLLSDKTTRAADAQKLKAHLAELEVQIEKSKDAKEIAELKNDRERVSRYYKKLTTTDEQWEVKKRTRGPLLGQVVFKANPKPVPVCVSGAVRVEAVPVPPDLLKRYSPDHLPLVLKIHAEPRLEWHHVADTLVVEAIGLNGRPVSPSFFTPKAYSNLANDELQFRRARLGVRDGDAGGFVSPSSGLVALTAPVDGQATTLKSIRGMVKATVWTPMGEITAVTGLDHATESTVDGPNGMVMGVKLKEPEANGLGHLPQNAVIVEVMLIYDPASVRLPTSRSSNDPLWLENGPGGRVVAKRAGASEGRVNPDEHGFTFADPSGRSIEARVYQQKTSQELRDDSSGFQTVSTISYILRSQDTVGKPVVAKVAFHGSRLKQVTVPFHLTDVPLAPGTGDGKPLPEDYSDRLKR